MNPKNGYMEMVENFYLGTHMECARRITIILFLCVEIYKSINSINPPFMNQIFRLRVTNRMVHSQYRLNLEISKVN